MGLPVAVKDIFDTCDLPTAYGATYMADDSKPKTEAAIVGAIRRAGGVVIGKTTTTEFAYLQPTETHNPNAPGHTPGGSSAGSAAAVAAGMVPWAIGTQTAGSIIRPAAYCGVVGFKPSTGLLPTQGLKCFSWSLDTPGLFAGNVKDVAILAQALTGGRIPAITTDRQHGIRVAVPVDYPWGEVSKQGGKIVKEAIGAWQKAGAHIDYVALPPAVATAYQAHTIIQGWEAWRSLASDVIKYGEEMSVPLGTYLKEARHISDTDYCEAQSALTLAKAQFAQWMLSFDVLLTPSTPDTAPLGLGSTGPSIFNRAWSMLGVPCITVPAHLPANALPFGVQLIAPLYQDTRLLQAAIALEAACDNTAGVPR